MQNHYFDDTHPLRPYTHSLAAMPGTTAPANALRTDAPAVGKGFWPCEKDGAWTKVEDHRDTQGYVDGEPFTMKKLGPYPAGWSETPPQPAEEDLREKRHAEILARLARIDADSIRPLRAIANDIAQEKDRSKLSALDAEAMVLRTELQSV